MFASNPFAELSVTISPAIMQAYVAVMIACVVLGTLLDVVHKGSARYFFANWRKAQDKSENRAKGGQIILLAIRSAIMDILLSAEFCNPNRRIAHLLGMYGFITFVVSTVVMVFHYSTPEGTPPIWPALWHIGALMICVGGYWFWFFIRVDVNAEGHSPFRLVRADLFILSLLGSATFGLIWAWLQANNGGALTSVFLGLFLIATTVLFAGIPWSKFSHMFFKPAAALQKRVEVANGTRSNLPAPTDKPAKLGDPRQAPNHY